MSLPKTKHRAEIDGLLSAFCDGRLDETGRSRITAILKADSEARRYYLHYLDVHMDLARRADIGKIVPFQSFGGRSDHPEGSRWLWAAAAAVAVAGITIGALVFGGSSEPAVADAPPAAKPVAYVSRAEGVRWQGIDAEPAVGLQIVPSQIALSEGRLRIDLFDGTGITFEAPATFKIGSAGEITLASGRLAVDRPDSKESLGFSVRTPNAVFVDIGTVFAVTVNDELSSQLQVVEGEVYTSLLGGGGVSLAERSGVEGEYLLVESENGITKANLDPSEFAKMLDPAAVPLAISEEYVGAVLDGAPLAYWRFESQVGGEVANLVSDRHSALLLGEAHLEGRPDNQVLYLDATDPARGAFVNDGFEGLNQSGQYSIELWMNPSSSDWSGLASLVELPELGIEVLEKTRPEHRMAAIECLPLNKHRWMRGGSKTVSFSHREPRREGKDWHGKDGNWKDGRDWRKDEGHRKEADADRGRDRNWAHGRESAHRERGEDRGRRERHEGEWSKDGNDQISTAKQYDPGQWHHVVAVREGGRIALYLDGKLDVSVDLAANADAKTYDLIIGRYSLAGSWLGRPFAGYIDELALYDRALTSAEIERHYRLVKP